jgi:hypothetical protein
MSTIEKPRAYATTGVAATSTASPSIVDARPEGLGWVLFSAITLGFVGVWGIIEGILALSSSKVFVASAVFVFSGLHTWGWIVLVLGVLCVMASLSLMAGSELARWFGIAVAGVNALGQLMVVNSNPWWSMAIFAIDFLIIYGLAAYGGARLRVR